jgi:protoheme ferro-lyase
MPNVSHSGNNHKEARSSSRSYINCKVSSVNEDNKAADLNDRLKLFLSHSLPKESRSSENNGATYYEEGASASHWQDQFHQEIYLQFI